MQEPEDIYYDDNDYETNLGGDFDGVELIEEDELSSADGDDNSFLDDIDFSEFKGKSFKSSLHKVNKAVDKRKPKKKKMPLS